MKLIFLLSILFTPLFSKCQKAFLRGTVAEVIKISLAGNKGNCSEYTTRDTPNGTKVLSWTDYHMHSKFRIGFDRTGISKMVTIIPDNETMLNGWINLINRDMTKIEENLWSKQEGEIVYRVFLVKNTEDETMIIYTYELQ